MQQMYSCPNCGAPVAFGVKFCTNCSTPLNWPVQQQMQPPPRYQRQQVAGSSQQPGGTRRQGGQGGYQQQGSYNHRPGQSKQKKTSPWLIGFLGLILVVALAGGAIFAIDTLQQETPLSTSIPSPNQPEEPAPEPILDSDGDGMSDWFEENIAHLDALTSNSRYAIILDTGTIHVNPYYTNQGREKTTNLKTFLIEEEKFKPENIFLFMDMEATYDNFKEAIDYLVKSSDENDLVYVMLQGHGSENSFALHTGKDSSEFEISDEALEESRQWYAWGYEEYWEKGGKEEARKNEQIKRAASGYSLEPEEINDLISKIEHKKMLFMVECCGGRELGEKISGEKLVVIARESFTATASTLIRAVVSPGAIDRELLGHSEEYRYRVSSLIKIDDGDGYPSITEVLAASLIDNHIKPWKEVREKSGLDCEAVLAMTDAKEIIEYVTNFKSNLEQVTPNMLDPQGLADDLYFGEAKIGNYRETDLYLLTLRHLYIEENVP